MSLFNPGSTIKRDDANSSDHSWTSVEASNFDVRIPGYLKTKRKGPSAASLYYPVSMDVFESPSRIDHITTRFPALEMGDLATEPCFKDPSVHMKPFLIFQMQIPSEKPSIFRSSSDGRGWSICIVFKLNKHICKELRDLANASAGVRLVNQWFQKCQTDKSWRGRFKLICGASNISEIRELSGVVKSYNRKPVLIRQTSSIFSGDNYLELDLHVFKFDRIAKMSIHSIQQHVNKMFMELGILIEARGEAELPEVILGCAKCNKPSKEKLVKYP